ncbi:MAG: efflux RND transporter periplasmic adaptor subunit [Nitrospiraceae bacterium]
MSGADHMTTQHVGWSRWALVGFAAVLLIAGAVIYLERSEGVPRPPAATSPEAQKESGQSTGSHESEQTSTGLPATPVDVQVANPIRREITYSITLPANVAPHYQATLYAKVSGYLKWIGPDKGDWVKKDQVVAIIDAPEVEEQYHQALADYKIKKITFERLAKVLKESPDVIAKQDVDVAEAAYEGARHQMEQREVLRNYTKVRTPFAGVITARFVDPGALIQIATTSATGAIPLFTLMDIETVRVYTNVPQEDAPLVKPGITEALLVVQELPGRQFKGTVTRTTFALDPSTRSLLVETDLPNPDRVLQPGTFGEITLHLRKQPTALVIPPGTIMTTGKVKSVFIIEQSHARRVTIQTGITDGRWVEVTEGLSGSEDVVVVGRTKLIEGSPVQAAPYNLPEGTPSTQRFERNSGGGATPPSPAGSNQPASR